MCRLHSYVSGLTINIRNCKLCRLTGALRHRVEVNAAIVRDESNLAGFNKRFLISIILIYKQDTVTSNWVIN